MPVRKEAEAEPESPAMSQRTEHTMSDVLSSGIDRTSLLSVSEVREKFSKDTTGPLIPKQLSITPHRSTQPVARKESQPVSPGRARREESMTQEETMQLAQSFGCEAAVKRFQKPCHIVIIIQVEGSGAPAATAEKSLLMREMDLLYHPDQRLLVMLHKAGTRYLRMQELLEIDARERCVSDTVRAHLPPSLQAMKPIALRFSTTPQPMLILLSTVEERADLIRLIAFLRQFVRTDLPFQVYE